MADESNQNFDGKNYSAAGTNDMKVYGLDSTPQKSKSLLGSKQQQKDLQQQHYRHIRQSEPSVKSIEKQTN